MPTKTLPRPKREVTQADVDAALRKLDARVAVIKREMAERDKEYERLRSRSRKTIARIEKRLANASPEPVFPRSRRGPTLSKLFA